jgi:ribosome-binding protein aMBF1 (putative translation factor)
MKFNEYQQKLRYDPEYLQAEQELRLHFELANAVLRARLKKGWSQADLASAIGTKQANISRIEAGLANPTLSIIQKLTIVLGLGLLVVPTDTPVFQQNTRQDKNTAIYAPEWPTSPCTPKYATRSNSTEKNQVMGLT